MSVVFGSHADFDGNEIRNVQSVDMVDASLSAGSISIAVTSPVQFSAFSALESRSAEYLLQLSQGSGYTQTKALIIHNGVDVGISEYAQVSIGPDIEYSLDAAILGGNCELTLQCPTANVTSVTLRLSRVLFDV